MTLPHNNAGLGIGIWHGAGAPACSSQQFRSLPPVGRAANWDRRPSMPDRRSPAGPNAPKSPELSHNTQPHIMTPSSAGHRVHTEHRAGDLLGAVALGLPLPGRSHWEEDVHRANLVLR